MNPLFVQTREELLKAVRIESAVDDQTIACIDSTIAEVRVGFVDELGLDRVGYIKAITSTDDPMTTDEYLRMNAEVVEILWVTILLRETLPTLFMSSEHLESPLWNEEPLTREQESGKTKMLDMMRERLNKGLAGLQEEDTGDGDVYASSIGPKDEEGEEVTFNIFADNGIHYR